MPAIKKIKKCRWLSIPLSVIYLFCNFHTIIIFFCDLFWNWKLDNKFVYFLRDTFGESKGIDKYSDIRIFTSHLCENYINVTLALLVTALFIIEIIIDIRFHEKNIFKWSIYFVLFLFINIIAFIASPIYLGWLPI